MTNINTAQSVTSFTVNSLTSSRAPSELNSDNFKSKNTGLTAVSKVSNFGLIKNRAYKVAITDLKCYHVTLESGFKIVVPQSNFYKGIK